VRADEKLTAFLELESTALSNLNSGIRGLWRAVEGDGAHLGNHQLNTEDGDCYQHAL